MSAKATLLRDASEAFTELRQAVAGLTDEEMGRVWFGTRSVREILIHISGWHDETVPALGRVAKGEAPYPAGTYGDVDAWNARRVDRKGDVNVANVLVDLDASHRAFITAAAAVPEPDFEPGGAARDPFEGSGPGHYREHAAQIREWRRLPSR
jgi:hypothetical protein